MKAGARMLEHLTAMRRSGKVKPSRVRRMKGMKKHMTGNKFKSLKAESDSDY